MNNVQPLTVQSLENDIEMNCKGDQLQNVSFDLDSDFSLSHTMLSFHNVNYTVMLRKAPFGACRQQIPKKILTDVRYILLCELLQN